MSERLMKRLLLTLTLLMPTMVMGEWQEFVCTLKDSSLPPTKLRLELEQRLVQEHGNMMPLSSITNGHIVWFGDSNKSGSYIGRDVYAVNVLDRNSGELFVAMVYQMHGDRMELGTYTQNCTKPLL